MLSIGTKKYRNLQEQVGYNTECIKKLDDYLDGITIEDKLVVIESDSGTFTEEELVILSGPLAFISNGSRVWMKDSETLIEFVYKAIDIKADEVGNAYFNIGGSKIVVNRVTGNYATSDDLIITTYSKAQLDALIANYYTKAEVNSALALKANLSGANFTGEITAPSVLEINTGYSFSKKTRANITIDYTYAGAVKTGNKLTCVCYFKLNRTDSVQDGYIPNCGQWNVPASIMPYLQTTSIGAQLNILSSISAPAIKQVFEDPVPLNAILLKGDANYIYFQLHRVNQLTLNADYVVRVEFTLLLSENLAS